MAHDGVPIRCRNRFGRWWKPTGRSELEIRARRANAGSDRHGLVFGSGRQGPRQDWGYGRLHITWEYGPDENTPGVLRSLTVSSAGPPTAANVFTTLEQQLGLKLERIKGPRGYLVIDHIERPIPDLPLTTPPLRAMGAGGG